MNTIASAIVFTDNLPVIEYSQIQGMQLLRRKNTKYANADDAAIIQQE